MNLSRITFTGLKNINTFFYSIATLFFVLFLLPGKYKIIVFPKNIYTALLGWSTVLTAILCLATYFWLLVVDLKKKNFTCIKRRTFFLSLIIIMIVIYKYYSLYSLGN